MASLFIVITICQRSIASLVVLQHHFDKYWRKSCYLWLYFSFSIEFIPVTFRNNRRPIFNRSDRYVVEFSFKKGSDEEIYETGLHEVLSWNMFFIKLSVVVYSCFLFLDCFIFSEVWNNRYNFLNLLITDSFIKLSLEQTVRFFKSKLLDKHNILHHEHEPFYLGILTPWWWCTRSHKTSRYKKFSHLEI